MSKFKQNRKNIIQISIAIVFFVILLQLINLQIISSRYTNMANSNAIYWKIVYPERGIIYDRKNRSVLENQTVFDLDATPSEIVDADTAMLCAILHISQIEYRQAIQSILYKNHGSKYNPGVFFPFLTREMYIKISENLNKFSGFSIVQRFERYYPYHEGANIFGYMGQVNADFLRTDEGSGYSIGDYTGITGLELSYEKVLMGQRGVEMYTRNNRNKIEGSYKNGAFDTLPVQGQSLQLALDIELQQLGEKLMQNKMGGIVAIDPRTGGILCAVSSPTYDPTLFIGATRQKYFAQLLNNPAKPLNNRAVSGSYSPGSTFKTFVGLMAMEEGVINESTSIYCDGAYYGCGRPMHCHSGAGYFNLEGAIAHSCNSYFANSFRRILENKNYPSIDSALNRFNQYAYSFGLGNRMGVDMPYEYKGNIPTPQYYKKIFGKHWKACNIISNSIGQGEISTTLLQMANVMAVIANKGWYYTPHMVERIGGDNAAPLLQSFKIKHRTQPIPPEIFEDVHTGMEQTMQFGTGRSAQIPGIRVCGKTGTIENAYKGKSQKDHAFFGAFAPRYNPRIAIVVICENAGFGASSAAPIASLMIEKYLKDSITSNSRKKLVEDLRAVNLLPESIRAGMNEEMNTSYNGAHVGKSNAHSIPAKEHYYYTRNNIVNKSMPANDANYKKATPKEKSNIPKEGYERLAAILFDKHKRLNFNKIISVA